MVHHLGSDDRSSPRVRIVDGMLRCLSRQGLHKTSLDDVARASGLSRATLYRVFPGGREAVLAAVVETEVARLSAALAVAMGEPDHLEDVLVAGMVEAARRLTRHEALAYLFAHEPGTVLPHLAFGRMDAILERASTFAGPFLGRWLEPDEACRAAEWATRIVLSYVTNPAPGSDPTDPDDVRRLVRTFVMPGIQALRQDAEVKAGTARQRRRPHTNQPSNEGSNESSATKTRSRGGERRDRVTRSKSTPEVVPT